MKEVVIMKKIRKNYGTQEEKITQIRENIKDSDAIIIGAGAGLSTAAGFVYSGEKFRRYFSDFGEKYGFSDMYSGGFYPYDTLEEMWAYWSRYIYINRYENPPKPVYEELFQIAKEKDYFVLTTNVDHCFQKAGFDKQRLFYTQGDYGLWQCSKPCHNKTYENEEMVRKMVLAQGFEINSEGKLCVPEGGSVKRKVPSDLVPHCPVCGKPMSMNLRADGTFVEEEGWHKAAERYTEFLKQHDGLRTVYLEIGVGFNTPLIIKFVLHRLTKENRLSTYACINYGEACAPEEIADRSIVINADAGEVIEALLRQA